MDSHFQPTKEHIKKGFEGMYNDLKDPEKREDARRNTERTKRIEDKKLDTGL